MAAVHSTVAARFTGGDMWGEFLASHAGHLLTLAVLLVLSGFFSGTETALFSLSRGRLMRLAAGGRAGRMAAAFMDRPQRLLNTLLLGNMLVNVSFAGVTAGIVFDLLKESRALAAAICSLGSLVVLILLGEVTPKLLAYAYAHGWSTAAAWPVAGMQRIFAPLLWVLEAVLVNPLTRLLSPARSARREVTVDELAAVLELSARHGTLDRTAHALLQEIVELSELRVGDIMVPRVDMIACDITAPPEELAAMFRETHLRKIPVFQGDADHILGMIHAKRLLLRPEAPLSELVAPVPTVPEAAAVDQALLQFRLQRAQMAIVVDEYGGTAGMVTLQDILEEVVGEMPDPHLRTAVPVVEKIDDRRYVLSGDLAVHEWVDAFGIDLSDRRISTVGGFVTSLIGRIPVAGDTTDYHNLRFTVESMRARRIGRLRLELK